MVSEFQDKAGIAPCDADPRKLYWYGGNIVKRLGQDTPEFAILHPPEDVYDYFPGLGELETLLTEFKGTLRLRNEE